MIGGDCILLTCDGGGRNGSDGEVPGVPQAGGSWTVTLHRLWRSVPAVSSRDELAGLVLPPLQGLPGVRATGALRYDPAGGWSLYRGTGGLPDGALRTIAGHLTERVPDAGVVVSLGAAEFDELRAHGVEQVIVAGFEVPGAAAQTFAVAVDGSADRAGVVTCLGQVVDVAREAVRRLCLRRIREEQQVRDALLAEASLQMDAVLDTTQTMQRVARMVVPAIAEGCLVYRYDEGDLAVQNAVHVDMRRLAAHVDDPTTKGVLAALARAAVNTSSPEVSTATVAVLGAGTVKALPLRARGRVAGVLILLFERHAERVPPEPFLIDLAHRAALAIDNGDLYEQRRREVVAMQQHLLPSRLPTVGGLRLAASYTVGDQVLEVGGDFYDVVPRGDGATAALIGDVCGRGTGAGALTGMARHTLGALLQEGVSPSRALSRLNTALRRDGSWRFVTTGVALLRPVPGGVHVRWTSAGHPAPIVMRRGAPAERGCGGGVPLGVLPTPRIGRSHLRLAPGDTMVMFTDGLVESRDATGAMFEDGAFDRTLDRMRDAPPETLVAELSRASRGFGVTGTDDIAILAIRVEERDGD